MRPSLFTVILLAISYAGFSANAQAPDLERMDAVQKALPDGPVALVDGEPVSRGDFLFLYHSQCMALSARGQDLTEEVRIKAGITTLAELIQREILNQVGKRRNLTVSPSDVDEAYKNQMETLVKRFTTDEHTPTEAEILERSGQTREDAMTDIRKALLVDKASEALAEDKNLSVTDAEVREFYEKYQDRFQRPGVLHLKQIYARPGSDPAEATEKDWAEAEKKINNAAARFKVGDTFEAIAKSMSDGKDRENGGDMELRPAQMLPPVYVERAKTMEIGETTPPFKSDYGWHIIRLVARESEESVPFDKAKERIHRQLWELKKLAAADEYCKPIMGNEERVQIFLDLEVPGATAVNQRS